MVCRGPVYVHTSTVAGQRWLYITFTDVEVGNASGGGGSGAAFVVQLRAFERSRRLEVSYGRGDSGSGSSGALLYATAPRARWGLAALLNGAEAPGGGVRVGSTLLLTADCTADAECAAPLVCTSGGCRERGVSCTRTGLFPSVEAPDLLSPGRPFTSYLVASCELGDASHDALFMAAEGVRLAVPLASAPFTSPDGTALPGAFRFGAEPLGPPVGQRLTLATAHLPPAAATSAAATAAAAGEAEQQRLLVSVRVFEAVDEATVSRRRRAAAEAAAQAANITVSHQGEPCALPAEDRPAGRRLTGCCTAGWTGGVDRNR